MSRLMENLLDHRATSNGFNTRYRPWHCAGVSTAAIRHILSKRKRQKTSLRRLGYWSTLARSIAELHGDSLEVFSEGRGKGSEFIVRLPISEDTSNSERAGLALDNGGNPHELSRRVLVVDDNRNQVESIAILLRRLGCDIRTANDGPSALEVLKEFHPEFALIDIGLPGIDGFELARRIRTADAFKNTVLIAQPVGGEKRTVKNRVGQVLIIT